MIILYGIITISMILLGIYSAFYKRGFWKKQSKKNFLDFPGLLLYETIEKIKLHLEGGQEREKKKQAQYRAVYIGKDDVLYRKREQARTWGYVWLVAVGVSIAGLVFCFITEDLSLIDGNKLKRPAFGEGEMEYAITVNGLGEETEQVTVTVGEQQPGESQMNAAFETALEEVKEEMLGENPSLEEVRTDLNFFTMTDQGIRLSWESGEETWLTSFGEIAAENIPEEGVLVPVTVWMTYATYEAWYEFYVRILPPIKDAVYYQKELRNILQSALEENMQNEYAELPVQLETFQLSYAMEEDKSGLYVGILGLAAVLALAAMSGRHVETQYEVRNQQMMQDYSQIIFQLSSLISCGMNLRSAWGRIVAEYEKRKAVNGNSRYAYEEMGLTNCQLEQGFQESRIYGEFGRRCGIYSYVKLGNLLEQGLRQGAAGMEAALYREAADALEQKIHEAKRKGEEAETKMLIPMFLMLGIVMAVLMVPAFLAF